MMTPLALALLTAAPAQVHIKVDGEGYFRFARGSQAVYTSDSILVNLNGLVCSPDGLPLLPQTRIAPTASISVSLDGTIASGGKSVGRIVLAEFPANALQKSGKYWITNTRSQIGFPGEGILGVIRGSSASVGTVSSNPTSTASASSTIEISLKTEVEKQDILLGDIATVQGSKSLEDEIAGIDLGASPIFGAQRGITRVYVLAAMRHAGINTDKITLLCPQGAFVVRKGQTVNADTLVQAAKDGVKQQLGAPEDLRCDRPLTDQMVPSGQLTLTAVQAVSVGDGYSVNLEIDVDGKMISRRTVSLMPTTPVQKVRQGDPVKVRVLKNGARVEVQGKTRAAGKIGSLITVETEEGATFTGTLISPSVVEVKL